MKKFLIIQTAFIGDVILATPLIEKLHRFFPDAQIDFLLRKGNESLLKDHPIVNSIIIWEKQQGKYKSLGEVIKKVRSENYDHVFNLQRFGASGIITWRSGAKEKCGFDKNPFSWSFDVKMKHHIGVKGDKEYTHETERNLSMIEHLTDDSFQIPKLYPSEVDFSKVAQYCNSSFVTLSPTSVWYTKQWAVEKWAELIDKIEGKQIFLLGGPTDKEACDNIAKKHVEKITNLAGELSLLQSAALMSKAEMNYVNDSAPMHLCSSMNAPVTAIYCSTIPEFGFGPLSDKKHIWQTNKEMACRPCGLHGHKKCPEGHFDCAYSITI